MFIVRVVRTGIIPTRIFWSVSRRADHPTSTARGDRMSQASKRESWNPLLKSYPFSEKINAVSIGAETLFTRLVAQADDYGNYWGNPRMILARLFPHRWAKKEITETDVGRWRLELVTDTGRARTDDVTSPVGPLAVVYKVNGLEYLHLLHPRRRFRSDVERDERFPREPSNLEEKALSGQRTEDVPSTARQRTKSGPLDQTQTRPRLDPEVKKKKKKKKKNAASMSARKSKAEEMQTQLKEEIYPRLKELDAKEKLTKKETEEKKALEDREAQLIDEIDSGKG